MKTLSDMKIILWFSILVMGICVSGCDQTNKPGIRDNAGVGNRPKISQPATAASDEWLAPSDAECLQFARSLEKAVESQSKKSINNLIFWNELLERAAGDIKYAAKTRQIFGKAAMQSDKNYADRLVHEVSIGATFRFLRIRQNGGQKRVLFRLLGPAFGNINYHDVILKKHPDGDVKAIDIYVFRGGELLSTSFRRLFLLLAAEELQLNLGQLTTEESDYIKNRELVNEIIKTLRSGEHERVLELYDTLPESLKRNKSLFFVKIEAASVVGGEAYTNSLASFHKYFPRDPSIDFNSVDYFFSKKQFDDVLHCLDNLDQRVGGDPYLNAVRAMVRIEQGQLDAARKLANKTIEQDSTLEHGYWPLVAISLVEKDFEKTAELLTKIADNFEIEFDDLTQLPEYEEFVKSPEYEQWLKSRKRN